MFFISLYLPFFMFTFCLSQPLSKVGLYFRSIRSCWEGRYAFYIFSGTFLHFQLYRLVSHYFLYYMLITFVFMFINPQGVFYIYLLSLLFPSFTSGSDELFDVLL